MIDQNHTRAFGPREGRQVKNTMFNYVLFPLLRGQNVKLLITNTYIHEKNCNLIIGN